MTKHYCISGGKKQSRTLASVKDHKMPKNRRVDWRGASYYGVCKVEDFYQWILIAAGPPASLEDRIFYVKEAILADEFDVLDEGKIASRGESVYRAVKFRSNKKGMDLDGNWPGKQVKYVPFYDHSLSSPDIEVDIIRALILKKYTPK